MATSKQLNEHIEKLKKLENASTVSDPVETREELLNANNLVDFKVQECDRLANYYSKSNELLVKSNFRKAKDLSENKRIEAQKYCAEESQRLEKEFNESAAGTKKDNDFIVNSDKYIKAKHAELKEKFKTIETIENNMKNVLGNIEFKNLSDLPTTHNKGLDNLFRTFFIVFYGETSERFNWAEFKKQAFEVDKG